MITGSHHITLYYRCPDVSVNTLSLCFFEVGCVCVIEKSFFINYYYLLPVTITTDVCRFSVPNPQRCECHWAVGENGSVCIVARGIKIVSTEQSVFQSVVC